MTAPVAADVATTVTATSGAATSARAVQLAIRAALMRDVAQLWPMLDAKRLTETFPAWLQAMMTLTRSYHGQSSVAAGIAYRAARQDFTQSPAPVSLIKVAPAPDPQWMTKAFGYAGPGMLTRDTAQPGTALSTTLGTASRIALDGGRTTTLGTTLADPVAVGWYRVTDAKPCAFCALLASRGVVYKEHSFNASDARFHGVGEFKVHNDCSCGLLPAFSRSHALPDVSTEADQVYRDRNKILRDLGKNPKDYTAMQAFRIAWAARQAR